MADDPYYRITHEDIEDLRDRGEDNYFLSLLAEWIEQIPALDAAIEDIKNAFIGMKLEDGTGLREAQGIDDYEGEEACAKLRATDEKDDWEAIEVSELASCYSAPSFMNPRGFVFHLPAFLIAELNDEHPYGFIDRIIQPHHRPADWLPILNNPQKQALANLLRVLSRHPDYSQDSLLGDKSAKHIRLAIERLESSIT
jgi:hypothetical protein